MLLPLETSGTLTRPNRPVVRTPSPICKRLLALGFVALSTIISAGGQNGELQQKLAAVRQAMTQNWQRLQQCEWTESTQLNLKSDPKPPQQKLRRYGPDGQVQ
jgi:hypothetical protein